MVTKGTLLETVDIEIKVNADLPNFRVQVYRFMMMKKEKHRLLKVLTWLRVKLKLLGTAQRHLL